MNTPIPISEDVVSARSWEESAAHELGQAKRSSFMALGLAALDGYLVSKGGAYLIGAVPTTIGVVVCSWGALSEVSEAIRCARVAGNRSEPYTVPYRETS